MYAEKSCKLTYDYDYDYIIRVVYTCHQIGLIYGDKILKFNDLL